MNQPKKEIKKNNCYKKYTTNNSSNKSNNSSNNSNNSNLCYFSTLNYIVLASILAISFWQELSATDIGILSTFLLFYLMNFH